MITVKLSGGLGNQMFQYAAGLTLANYNKTNLCLNISEFDHYPLRDYMLDVYNLSPNIMIDKSHKNKIVLKIQKLLKFKHIYSEPHYHFDNNFFNLPSSITIYGYFQSDKYFQNTDVEIRKNFRLKKPLSKNSLNFKEQIKNSKIAISVHMRRGDYVSDLKTQQVHGTLSDDYYKKSMQLIMKKYSENVTFYMFSDDMSYIEEEYKNIKNKVIITGNSNAPHEDLYLMSQCHHHIIANSSFSWWGAWLNPSGNKTVISPKNWFSANTLKTKSIKDLIPENWIQI